MGLSRMAKTAQDDHAAKQEHEPAPSRGFLRESLEGFRTIGSDKRLRTLVSLFTAQTMVAGALNVFVVVLALILACSGKSTWRAITVAV